MAGSFFVQTGYGPVLLTTLEDLAIQAVQSAGAVGPKSVTVMNPNGSDDITLFFVNAAVTAQQITASVKGTSPSIKVDIVYGSTPSASGTSLVTGGITVTDTAVVTSFSNASIPANSYVRLKTSSMTGAVTELAVSIDF